MPLHLVGETIAKARSHYLAETGRLVALMRGIYVDADDDVDATVLAHAVRIARYLYPRTYLSAASAVVLAPLADGRLYLSGPRNQRTRIRALEIVQNKAPPHPSTAPATIADDLGEFTFPVSTPRQRLLEAFRLRSEHAASLDGAMRERLAERLVAEYGDARQAADAVWTLARANDWYREGEGAERWLLRGTATVAMVNAAAFALVVAWHGREIGTLAHDGFEWRWTPTDEERLPPLVRQTVPGQLPPFIVSLLPEGWLEHVLKAQRDERAVLRSGRRYLSNITIGETPAVLRALPADVLSTPLRSFTREEVFAGTYAGPGRGAIELDFEQRLAALYASADTPRLSGVQVKAPMHLDHEGRLSPAVELPFTHILKPAGTGGFEALPVVEWLGLSLARAVDLPVPDASLVPMPDGMPPALLVERFDIREADHDLRFLALEDFCSVLGLPPHDKYSGTIERVARSVRALSTSPDEDLRLLLRRVLFAWLIADGDMHLKNLALLKTARSGRTVFDTVRIAPVYDALTTRVFPGLAHDRMALKLNGKDERLRRKDFVALATLAGLRAADANAVVDDVLTRLAPALDRIALPTTLDLAPPLVATVARTRESCASRIAAFA